jgi:hypothetical protein
VFNLKLKALQTEIFGSQGVFGPSVAHAWVIEYQKRGMPHAHILLWLKPGYHFDTPDMVDEVISAEIPSTHGPFGKELYKTVTTCLMHKPCGDYNPEAPCMDKLNGVPFCSKGFLRPYSDQTVMDEDGYPHYRRSAQTKIQVDHPIHRRERITVGNEWVVPHNPYLAWRYDAHINVEICRTIKAVKYIHKYIYNGPDRLPGDYSSSRCMTWNLQSRPWWYI